MPTQDMYHFMVPQKPPKKPYRTRYRLTVEEAAKRYPGAIPDLLSKEVREVGSAGVTSADQPLTPGPPTP